MADAYTIRLTVFNIVQKMKEGTKMQKIELMNCNREVFVSDDYEELLDFEWYEYTDPFSGRTFTAHDTDSGRRVLMHNVIAKRDVLDDDEAFDFGRVICAEADQVGSPKGKYRGRLLLCPGAVFQITSNIGPPAHFETTEEHLDSFSTNHIIDEEVKVKILKHFIEKYSKFISDLSTDKPVDGNGIQRA
jgi:hypothetical protein